MVANNSTLLKDYKENIKREDARNLIKLGVELEIIAKGTGLSREIINQIQEEVLKEYK